MLPYAFLGFVERAVIILFMHLVCMRKLETSMLLVYYIHQKSRASKRVQVGVDFMFINNIPAYYVSFPLLCPLLENIPVLQPDALLSVLQERPLRGRLDWAGGRLDILALRGSEAS